MPDKYKDEKDYVFSYLYTSVFHQKFVLQKRIQSISGLGIFFCNLSCHVSLHHSIYGITTTPWSDLFTNRGTLAINIYLENGK